MLSLTASSTLRVESIRPQSVETALPTVQTYNPVTDTWSIAPNMPTPRVNHGVAVANGTLYAIGGNFPGVARVGQPFIYQVTASNHPTSYTASGLPSGLHFDNNLGLVYGIPTTPVAPTVHFTATNADGTGSASTRLVVLPVPSPSGPGVTNNTSATGRTGHAFSFQTLTENASLAARITAGGLPPGLSFDPITNLILGTPTSDGNFGVVVSLTDGSTTKQALLQFTNISDPTVPIITSADSATLTPGQDFSYTMTADVAGSTFGYIGNDGILHHGVSSAGLPAGLAFDGIDTISGTFTGGSINGVVTDADGKETKKRPLNLSSLTKDKATRVLLPIKPPSGRKPDTITIRPPLHSSCQLVANNANGVGTNPLNFFLSGYMITLDASPESAGTVSGVYNLDSTVSIFATPNNGFIFLNWMEDGLVLSTSPSYTFLATRNRTLTAHFAIKGSATPTPTPTPAPLGNISTRLQVGTDANVLIAGFIVQGTFPKRVIIRAAGPSLANFGVPDPLANPQLELHDSVGVIGMNDDWQTTQIGGVITANQVADIQASGLAPSDPAESALIATLPPANYTAIAEGVNGITGTGIVEIYDLEPTSGSRLANVSTRGLVQTGDNVMIGGFIVSGGIGSGNARVIVRALGPSIPVAGALVDPTLALHDGNGALMASNDNWRSDQEPEIIATTIPPANDLEAAIVRTFPPGNYTAIVRGVGNTTGVGLVEMYRLQQ